MATMQLDPTTTTEIRAAVDALVQTVSEIPSGHRGAVLEALRALMDSHPQGKGLYGSRREVPFDTFGDKLAQLAGVQRKAFEFNAAGSPDSDSPYARLYHQCRPLWVEHLQSALNVLRMTT